MSLDLASRGKREAILFNDIPLILTLSLTIENLARYLRAYSGTEPNFPVTNGKFDVLNNGGVKR